MGLPGSVVPPGEDWIPRELRDLRQMIERNAAARSAEQTAVGAGGIRSSDFDGTGPDDPGTQGWMIGRIPGGESYLIMSGRMAVQGDTSIAGMLEIVGAMNVTGPLNVSGAMAVTGTLSLPAGIIDNEALAHPVIFSGTWNQVSNYAIPTTSTEIVRAEFTVPENVTQMKFEVVASVQLGNTSGSAQYIYVQPKRLTNGVLTNSGARQAKLFTAGAWDSMIAPYLYTDTVTPGDVIAFTLETYAGTTALAAHASNGVRLEVSITLTR